MVKSSDIASALIALDRDGVKAEITSEKCLAFLRKYQLESFLPKVFEALEKCAEQDRALETMQVLSA
ncbi:MAG: hypothetical protein Q8P45_03235, partial [Candidatus Harrisonbacteria bacterium]|nr:hypothetical protein [Candidatus Harrisonbacteria bacterium]